MASATSAIAQEHVIVYALGHIIYATEHTLHVMYIHTHILSVSRILSVKQYMICICITYTCRHDTGCDLYKLSHHDKICDSPEFRILTRLATRSTHGLDMSNRTPPSPSGLLVTRPTNRQSSWADLQLRAGFVEPRRRGLGSGTTGPQRP